MSSRPASIEPLEPRAYFAANKPDVSISPITPITASFVAGVPSSLTVKLNNIGKATAAGKVTLKLIASTDKRVDTSDPTLATLVKSVNILKNKSATQRIKFTPSAKIADGNYFLFLRATTSFADLKSNNNTARTTTAYPFSSSAMPDFSLAFDGTLTTNFPFGTPNTVAAILRNLGPGNSTKPFVISLYASNDTASSSDDILLTTYNFTGKLKAKASADIPLTFTTPNTFISGDDYIIAKVDSANAIQESNETNNILVSPLKIHF